jgi:hypothetical protein
MERTKKVRKLLDDKKNNPNFAPVIRKPDKMWRDSSAG